MWEIQVDFKLALLRSKGILPLLGSIALWCFTCVGTQQEVKGLGLWQAAGSYKHPDHTLAQVIIWCPWLDR